MPDKSLSYTKLDSSLQPTIVIRSGDIIYANPAMAGFLCTTVENLQGSSYINYFAEDERERISDRYSHNNLSEHVISDYETVLISQDGMRKPVRAISSLTCTDFIVSFNDISAEIARRKRLDGLAKIGASLQAECSIEAVLNSVSEQFENLSLSLVTLTTDGTRSEITFLGASTQLIAAIRKTIGQDIVGIRGLTTPLLHIVWHKGVVFDDNAPKTAGEFFGGKVGERIREIMQEAGFTKSGIIRLDVEGEPTYLLVILGGWLSSEDMPVFRLFASQVAAALTGARMIATQKAVAVENARLYKDLKHSYETLEETQRQLVERERLAAIGELAAVVAHEVRNPLNVIFNSLGSLNKIIKFEGNAKILLDIIGEEADRLNRIVNDLLDYARPVVVKVRPESLTRILEEAVTTALETSNADIRLESNIDSDLPAIPTDARLVRQMVLNIAMNAVQAMPQGGVLSLRATTQRENAKNNVRIDIGDTGTGITKEVIEKIFKPFFTTKSTGTGLGLAIVKRIIDNLFGEISLKSELGAGTTFTIKLPIEEIKQTTNN
ncbi:MAG: PAS domain S-box protein [Deltaproteobacteria bacterium]|nr:PAS domain S-box protein [Deltaproteobacteria bacterium]